MVTTGNWPWWEMSSGAVPLVSVVKAASGTGLLASVEELVLLLPVEVLAEVAVLPLEEFELLDEVDCSRELFLFDDRLVAVDELPSTDVVALNLLAVELPTPLVELAVSSELALLLDEEELDDEELDVPCR